MYSMLTSTSLHILYTYSVNSQAVSTEAVGFVGSTVLEVVGETVPEETTSAEPAI